MSVFVGFKTDAPSCMEQRSSSLFQNGTESVMCGSPKREMGMNLKKVGSKFLLVNEPADDLQLAIVEAALAEGAGK